MLLDYLDGEARAPLLERDDGTIRPALGPDVFFAGHAYWPVAEREAIGLVRGRVLDIGCGAGRHALHLQEAGREVVAIDISPGAVTVCRRRGVKDARLLTAEEVDEQLGRFDSVLMMCGNFGLVGNREGAHRLLERIAAVSNPHALLLADCVAGRAARLRLRYGGLTTPWFDWFNPSRTELVELAAATRWSVERFIAYDDDPAAYVAVLTLDG